MKQTWINDHKEEAIKSFNTEPKKLTGKTIAEDELRGGGGAAASGGAIE